MVYCMFCGQEMDEDDVFCPMCGKNNIEFDEKDNELTTEEESQKHNKLQLESNPQIDNDIQIDDCYDIELLNESQSHQNTEIDSMSVDVPVATSMSEMTNSINKIDNDANSEVEKKVNIKRFVLPIIIIVILTIAIVGVISSGVFDSDKAQEIADDSETTEIAENINLFVEGDILFALDDDVKLYEDADNNSSIIMSLDKFEQVVPVETSGSMVKVYYEELEGWVDTATVGVIYSPERYNSNDLEADYIIDSNYEEGIAVHTEPGKNSKILFRLKRGTTFTVLATTDNNYGFINQSETGMNGWVNLDYASDIEYFDGYEIGQYYYLHTNVFVREGPDKSYNKVWDDAVEVGKSIQVYDIYEDIESDMVWVKIDAYEDWWMCAKSYNNDTGMTVYNIY